MDPHHVAEHSSLIVSVCFYSAFALDLLIVWYALNLTARMGSSSILSKTTIYSAVSAMVFGLHHILEVLLEDIPYGLDIAESIEFFAVVFLGLAVYQLYKLTSE